MNNCQPIILLNNFNRLWDMWTKLDIDITYWYYSIILIPTIHMGIIGIHNILILLNNFNGWNVKTKLDIDIRTKLDIRTFNIIQ